MWLYYWSSAFYAHVIQPKMKIQGLYILLMWMRRRKKALVRCSTVSLIFLWKQPMNVKSVGSVGSYIIMGNILLWTSWPIRFLFLQRMVDIILRYRLLAMDRENMHRWPILPSISLRRKLKSWMLCRWKLFLLIWMATLREKRNCRYLLHPYAFAR